MLDFYGLQGYVVFVPGFLEEDGFGSGVRWGDGGGVKEKKGGGSLEGAQAGEEH